MCGGTLPLPRATARVAPTEGYKRCGGRRDTWVPPYNHTFCRAGPVCPAGDAGKTGRADVGSELSAASGRGSEVSEWPRSKFPASAVRQRRNFGHRNRIIGPYGSVSCGA